LGKIDWKDKEAVRQYKRQYYQRPEVKERCRQYQRQYYQRPEVKERERQYRQRPEVKERQRQYSQKYYQRPEMKERQRQYQRQYYQRPEVSLLDVFDFDEPLTLKEIRERGASTRNLKSFMKIKLILQTKDGKYKINTDSPFHVIADGFFIKKLEEEKRQ